MNKDVIYIEPEDDITDIIVKIENSKEKIIALVPPKKAGVFRSVVNIKLMAKSAASSGKTVVLVTTDPSIIKLAGASKLPVTKNLQSAPTIPKVEAENNTAKEDLVEKDEDEEDDTTKTDDEEEDEEDKKIADNEEPEDDKEEDEDEDENENEESDEEEDEELEEDKKLSLKKKSKEKKTKSKTTASGNKFVAWFKDHKIRAIACCCGGILLILFLVWALVIAPAVTITVGIKTDSHNFSENVTFSTKLEEENADEGKFYLDEKKVESTQEIEFEATGKKNVGEKAKGEITVIARINYKGGTKQVSAGDKFTISGLTFVAETGVTMRFDGEDYSVCTNIDDTTPIGTIRADGCVIYGKVKVIASEPGTKYNISPAESGWTTTAEVSVLSDKAMSGGTDQEITIVQQSDIDKAKAELTTTDEAKNKEDLLESIDSEVIIINASFNQSASEAISTPAVNEEVKEGVKPTLKATTKTSVYVIDKTKIEEFITKKAQLGEAQKIYEIKDPFIENFSNNSNGITGKLKTSYLTGPKITENDVIEKTKGKGLGEAQHDLRDISGVSAVTIDKSFPWVMSVPGDSNKITVIFDVKDQNGNEVKEKKEEPKAESKDESKESTEEKKSE